MATALTPIEMLEAAAAAGKAPATCMKARRPVFIVALPAKATAAKYFCCATDWHTKLFCNY
jgi:hypothetical protein